MEPSPNKFHVLEGLEPKIVEGEIRDQIGGNQPVIPENGKEDDNGLSLQK